MEDDELKIPCNIEVRNHEEITSTNMVFTIPNSIEAISNLLPYLDTDC